MSNIFSFLSQFKNVAENNPIIQGCCKDIDNERAMEERAKNIAKSKGISEQQLNNIVSSVRKMFS